MRRSPHFQPLDPEQIVQLGEQGFLYVPRHLDTGSARSLGETILAIGESHDQEEGVSATYDDDGIASNQFMGDLKGLVDVTQHAYISTAIMNMMGLTTRDETMKLWEANYATLLRYQPGTVMEAHQDDRDRFIGVSVVINATQEAETTVYNGDPKLGGIAVSSVVMKPGDMMLYVARPLIETDMSEPLYTHKFPWHSIRYDGTRELRAAVSYDFSTSSIADAFTEWALKGNADFAPKDEVAHALYYDLRAYYVRFDPEFNERLRPMSRWFSD